MIFFNKPYISSNELKYIKDAIEVHEHISGNGHFTKLCHSFFMERYKFPFCLLTTSCTDALEMTSILMEIKPGDEVIIPSYTFVSTVNAFVLRDAKIIFADSQKLNPNIDVDLIESLITPKTKAIVVVHYAGIACDMDRIMLLAKKYNIYIIEDAAQAIDSFYKGTPLGSIGHLAVFSFHETKNIIAGEGGMLVVNQEGFRNRAEIIWEKGTNRSAFYRGEVDKYGWVDIGSSFLPSDIIAAFLYAQLENLDKIQKKRKALWNLYFHSLEELAKEGIIKLPYIPDFSSNNAHIFYIICQNLNERDQLIDYLKKNDVYPVFHYLSLHKSPYFREKHDGRELPESDRYTDCLLRLPLYFELSETNVIYISDLIKKFYM